MILTQVERNCTICGLKYRESASLLFCVSAVSVSVCLFTFSSVCELLDVTSSSHRQICPPVLCSFDEFSFFFFNLVLGLSGLKGLSRRVNNYTRAKAFLSFYQSTTILHSTRLTSSCFTGSASFLLVSC